MASSSPTWPLTLRVIIVSLLVSLAGGVLAAALTIGSFSDYATALGELVSPLRLSSPRVSEESEAPFERLRDKALSTTVQVTFSAPGAEGIDPGTADGHGVVLTSDGWIATAFVRAPIKAVLVGRRSYAVERTAADPATGVLFVKTGARNLPAATFGNAYDARPGQLLYVAEGESSVRRTSLVSSLRPASVGADRFLRRLSLAEYVADDGAGIFDVQGNLLAISGAEGVVPLELVLSAFRALVKEGVVEHASLGAPFLDLSVASAVPVSRTNGRESGALIGGVGKGTSAEASGLHVGDIVTSVDGKALDAFYSLDDAVGAAVAGQELVASVDRAGTAVDVRIKLR